MLPNHSHDPCYLGESDLTACCPCGQQCSHSDGVCPQIHGLQCDVYVGAVEEMMYVNVPKKRGDGCHLAATLCTYDFRKGDLFVLSWARVRRGSIFSELILCCGGVCSILLLPLVTRCLETIDYVDGTCFFFVCCSHCGSVCCVVAIVEDSGF